MTNNKLPDSPVRHRHDRPYVESVAETTLLEESRLKFEQRIKDLFGDDWYAGVHLVAHKENALRERHPAEATKIMDAILASDETLMTSAEDVDEGLELRKKLETDGKTGAFTWAECQKRIEFLQRNERARGVRANRESDASENRGFSIIMLDIDYFKRINDTFGHIEGDAVLKEIVRRVKSLIREAEGDMVARFGGEEFVVVLRNTGESAISAAERLRHALESKPFDIGSGRHIPVTASFGVAPYDLDTEVMLKRADNALYKSKQDGRNRVTSAEEIDAQAAA